MRQCPAGVLALASSYPASASHRSTIDSLARAVDSSSSKKGHGEMQDTKTSFKLLIIDMYLHSTPLQKIYN